ncbi:MAG: ostA-like family protein [Alphaproteobacteria bacterium]|nr:ostA-like family protein [Alphaproteobacteria bacterium]
MKKALFCLLALLVLAPSAWAQQKQPLEVTADGTLEWHRDAKLYIARKNAVAKQGTSEIHADTLTASYSEGAKNGAGGINISRIDAEGGVRVLSDGSTATGDKGYYDVKTGYSELTGGDLMLKTPTDTVTARDKLTYDAKKSEMNAYGQAKAVRGDDVITADRLIGRFEKDATGNSKMKELEAVGNVVITTPTEVLQGERGVYNAKTNIANITGNVRIDRGESFITGTRGEVDLNTNISKMYGGGTAPDGTSDGRVRGVFYPE